MYFSLHPLKKGEQNIIHRGKLLKKVVEASPLTVVDVVARMKYASRNTYYSHTKDPNLSLALLKRYSVILRYDFSEDIAEMSTLVVEEEIPSYLPAPVDLQDAISQRDYYHRLYFELLEKLRKLELENRSLRK